MIQRALSIDHHSANHERMTTNLHDDMQYLQMTGPADSDLPAQARSLDNHDEDSDPEYARPLQHKRAFGAGIKRKRIEFVPQAKPAPSLPQNQTRGVGDRYLSIVLPGQGSLNASNHDPAHVATASPPSEKAERQPTLFERESEGSCAEFSALCEVCKLPIASASIAQHTSTLAHQVCLPHSHPPSHLDRQRKGLSYLSSYGWDPDARLGLGAQGEGRLHPIKAKERQTNLGIGAEEGKKREMKDEAKRAQQTRKERLKAEKRKRARDQKMQMLVFGKDEVNKHLGVEL